MKEHKSVKDLILENEALEARNEFLEKCVNALKLNLSKTTQERNEAIDKLHKIQNMSMWDFADKYCSEDQLEEDGRLFARELLRTRVTGEYKDNETAARIAEEEFIAQGEKHYNDTWNIACGDDF